MWRKQIRAEKAAEEARVLSDRAAALREQAMARPGSRDGLGSEETSDSDNADNGSEAPRTSSGALGYAADALRRGADLVRGSLDDRKPPGNT